MRIANALTLAALALAIAGCSRPSGNQAAGAGNQAAGGGNQPAGQPVPAPRLAIDTPALVRACLTPEDARRPVADFTAGQRLAFVVCGNREAARQVNRQLPARIDQLTTLTAIAAEDATVVYTYSVDLDAASFTDERRRQLEQATRTGVCAQSNMVQTMAMGGSYAYVWIDRAGRPIHHMRIDGC